MQKSSSILPSQDSQDNQVHEVNQDNQVHEVNQDKPATDSCDSRGSTDSRDSRGSRGSRGSRWDVALSNMKRVLREHDLQAMFLILKTFSVFNKTEFHLDCEPLIDSLVSCVLYFIHQDDPEVHTMHQIINNGSCADYLVFTLDKSYVLMDTLLTFLEGNEHFFSSHQEHHDNFINLAKLLYDATQTRIDCVEDRIEKRSFVARGFVIQEFLQNQKADNQHDDDASGNDNDASGSDDGNDEIIDNEEPFVPPPFSQNRSGELQDEIQNISVGKPSVFVLKRKRIMTPEPLRIFSFARPPPEKRKRK